MAVDTLDPNLLASSKKAKAPPPIPEAAGVTRRRNFLKAVAYTAIFLAAVIFFFYIKTPASIVQGFVLNTLNQGGSLQWQADSISTRMLLLPHLRAENLSVAPTRGNFPPMKFDTMRIYPSFLSLIPWTGKMNPALSFDGTAYKAEFSGKAWPNGSALNLSIENMDFTELVPLLEAGVRLKGVVESLDTELELVGGRLSQANGTITAKGKNFVVDPSAFSLPLPLPILDLGALDLQARADKGRLNIEKFSIGTPGKDLEVRGTGSIQLMDTIQFSRLDLRLRIKPSAKIISAMPALQGMLTTIAAPQSDGFYAMKLSGTFMQMGLKADVKFRIMHKIKY
jgi:type II secretion system protein N